MSGMMLHGLGDCTPELHCGCLGRFHVGQKVIYRPRPDAPPEEGFVTSMNERFVFVRYGNDVGGRATRPDDLEPIYRGAEDECDCYPGGFSPETYEGPSRWCPMHGEVCEGALRCPGNPPPDGSGPVSASPAVVAAVQQAMTAHLADFDIEVAAQRCRCGLVVGDSVQAEAHRVEMVAAAVESAALESAAEAVGERVPYGVELLPDGREDPAMAAVVEAHREVWAWLRERAGEMRS